jgi:hypothetical protein
LEKGIWGWIFGGRTSRASYLARGFVPEVVSAMGVSLVLPHKPAKNRPITLDIKSIGFGILTQKIL